MVTISRPPLDGVVETCVYVEDVARSRDFYRKVFGFTPMVDKQRICALDVAPGRVFILFQRDGTLEPVPAGDSFIPPHNATGEQHFAFGVALEDFEDWKSFLEGLDIGIESVVNWPQGGKSLYFRDPDRLLVELITPGMWPNS